MADVGVDVVVLNGGSSSGKSSIARALQLLLSRPFLTFGVDTLLAALPTVDGDAGMNVAGDGTVTTGHAFRRLEDAWYRGLRAMAQAGAGLVVDEVFLGGAASQERLAGALQGVPTLWVGVRCNAEVAAARERRRQDRPSGMAVSQAQTVHDGVCYDVQVDTTHRTPHDCAEDIRAAVGRLVDT